MSNPNKSAPPGPKQPLWVISFLALILGPSVLALDEAHAANATECTRVQLCYCVNPDFASAIAEKVAYFRTLIAEERAKGKAIGYLSIPLSTAGGSYFDVNREVAQQAKERIEARFGPTSVWVLNPTAKDADMLDP